MKKFGLFGVLGLFSAFSAQAADCIVEAKKVAQMNLDQFAGQYGYATSEIAGAKVIRTIKKKITKTISETLAVIQVDGSIYRATYTVTVVMDEACAVRSVNVHDDASL